MIEFSKKHNNLKYFVYEDRTRTEDLIKQQNFLTETVDKMKETFKKQKEYNIY